jgi:FkbM family methyltransferase
MPVKKALKRLINGLGYDVRRRQDTDSDMRTTMAESYALMHRLGFRPKVIVDVGVGRGTSDLHSAFPEAYLLLIEPLAAFEPVMVSALQGRQGSYVLAAAGASAGTVSIHVHDDLEGSSLYEETMGAEADGFVAAVPQVTIDDVLAEKRLHGPFLIKADVQGAELDVLRGAQGALAATEAVVLEVSLFGFQKGAPQFYDVVQFMKERDFVAYDIIEARNRPLDSALGQVDIVFVRESGRFRQDHSWARLGHVRQGGARAAALHPPL